MLTLLQYMLTWVQQNWFEFLAIVTGFLCLYFEITENYLTWLFAIISSAMYAVFLYRTQLYMQGVFQAVSVIISLFGLYKWLFGSYFKDKPKLQISNLSAKGWVWLIGATVTCTIITYQLELRYGAGNFALEDCFSGVLGIFALYLVAVKIIEQWFLWILADGIPGIILACQKHYGSALLFLCYAILAVVGYFNWLRIQNQNAEAKKHSYANISN